MAPRGSKRASTAGTGAAKRHAAANPVFDKCDMIAKALSAASRDVVPKTASDMLIPMLRPCLAVPKEQRHDYQASVVGMLGTVMQDVANALDADIESRRLACGGVEADRTERRTAVKKAEADVSELEAAVAAKKEALDAAAAHCSKKATELVSTEKALNLLESESSNPRRQALRQQGEIKKAQEAFEHLKGSCAGTPEGKAQHKQLTKACTVLEIESDLAEVVLKCLKRDAALRQECDIPALQKFEEELQKRTPELDQKLQALDEPLSQAKEAVRVAREARTVADAARTACHGELSQARVAQKAGHQQVKVAEKHLAAWWRDTQVTMDGYDKQVKALAAFREGPLVAFAALRDLQPEPEVVVAEEVEPVAAVADIEEHPHDGPRSDAAVSV